MEPAIWQFFYLLGCPVDKKNSWIELSDGVIVPNTRFQRVLGAMFACRGGRLVIGGNSFKWFASLRAENLLDSYKCCYPNSTRSIGADWYWLALRLSDITGRDQLAADPQKMHAALLEVESAYSLRPKSLDAR
jgi:hypothetical protein